MGVGLTSCVRYLVFFFNLVFALCGLCILAFGAVCLFALRNSSKYLENVFTFPTIVILVIGGIIAFIAFFGCCGAVREHHCMLVSFGGLLITLFVIELAVIGAGYYYRDDLSEQYKEVLADGMTSYSKNDDAKKLIDDLQATLQCCGVNGPSDYPSQSQPIPDSCCRILPLSPPGSIDTMSCSLESAYPDGCYNKSESRFTDFLFNFGIFGACVAVIQLVGILFAFCLARSIRRGYEIV